jgi:hypothetical protein
MVRNIRSRLKANENAYLECEHEDDCPFSTDVCACVCVLRVWEKKIEKNCSQRGIFPHRATDTGREKRERDIFSQQKHNAASVYCLPTNTTYTTVHREEKEE